MTSTLSGWLCRDISWHSPVWLWTVAVPAVIHCCKCLCVGEQTGEGMSVHWPGLCIGSLTVIMFTQH